MKNAVNRSKIIAAIAMNSASKATSERARFLSNITCAAAKITAAATNTATIRMNIFDPTFSVKVFPHPDTQRVCS